MWLCCGGPFTSPPLTDLHISNFGVVPVIIYSAWTLLGGTNVSISGMGLASSWCQNALWVMEPSSRTSPWSASQQPLSCVQVTLPHFVAAYLGALSGPLCGSSSGAPMSSWRQFYSLILPEIKLVALCLLPTLNPIFQFPQLRHLAPQRDLAAFPIPTDLCKLCLSLYE